MTRARRERAAVFSYEGFTLAEDGVLTCTYAVDGETFAERFDLDVQGADLADPAVLAAARLLHLLAGVSYYKTGAPPLIRGPEEGLTEREREFLLAYHLHGLAEFAYRSGADIEGLRIEAADRTPQPHASGARADRPLVPFGGGIDSIVVATRVAELHPEASLFVANTSDTPFVPIEETAELTKLPVRRVRRHLDPKVLRSRELGYLNGHVPVTGVLSAAAVLTAVLGGHGQVVMSNEHSASEPTGLRANGVAVNHQWSKSLMFEELFRGVLAETVPDVAYYSALRPFSELWVSRRFADLRAFHLAFRSCNRAFHVDAGSRLPTWCGHCDKCAFIDLVLAPYLPPAELEEVFRGREPLQDPALEGVFRSLLGTPGTDKPLECVGDEGECRAAVRLAAARPDRAGNALLERLAAHVEGFDPPAPAEAELLTPQGRHFVPAGLL